MDQPTTSAVPGNDPEREFDVPVSDEREPVSCREQQAATPLPAPEFDTERPIVERVEALVRRWMARSGEFPVDAAAQRLAGVLQDPNGLDFILGFLDGVVRPDDLSVAAENLAALTAKTPAFLSSSLRAAIATGGALGPVLPWVVVPGARRMLWRLVRHLVVDASEARLGAALARLREGGDRLNLALPGERVLGEGEAQRRLDETYRLLRRPDVDSVSVTISSIVSPLSPWAYDDAIDRVVERLAPLYHFAATSPTPKFITLETEEYRDRDLTFAVFRRLLDRPELRCLEAGIVLQAYLPDAVDVLREVTAWAMQRRQGGGAPITIRVVKGANLRLERVEAALHDWPLATVGSKVEADTNYKRVIDWALRPEHTEAVRIGVACHNLCDIAFAWITAHDRGVAAAVDFEMMLGMVPGQASAIREDVGRLLLSTPVVHPHKFDAAVSYLIRRLDDKTSPDSFLASFALDDERMLQRELDRFCASLEALGDTAPTPNRTQDRLREWSSGSGSRLVQEHAGAGEHPQDPAADGLTQAVLGLSRGSGEALATASFRNEPDTDLTLAGNRRWAALIAERIPSSTIGEQTADAARVTESEQLQEVLRTVAHRAERWGERLGYDRAAILDRAGLALAANRDRLIEVMAAETGKTIVEADPEVSEAIDSAHYYATCARELDAIGGATFVPDRVTVVAPPRNSPVAILGGSIFAALAAGSGVVITPAPQARRCAAVLVETLWDAGIPAELLALVNLDEETLGRALISDPLVDRVLLTGSYETAKLFRSWRLELPLHAETNGKNAIIVTPNADYTLAVADIVSSAFGNAGQKCSAASLVILVGSVARSSRFRAQLVDAVTSLRVGWPEDPTSVMGPLIEAPTGKLAHALTTLGAGESWLVQPRQLDDSGRLWSPGVREGVSENSYLHLTEFFGPVLGILHASTLEDAIRIQNGTDYGLTAGLHSLRADEIALWLDSVEAGNLYVNRATTGAIVRRQPFGGWKKSSVGGGAKAGGPNRLIRLGSWKPAPARPSTTLHLRGLDDRVRQFIEAAQSSLQFEQFDLLRRSALSDQLAWSTEFGVITDMSKVGVERNLFRYLRIPIALRLADGGDLGELLRVMVAGLLSRSRMDISTSLPLPPQVQKMLEGDELCELAGLSPRIVVESDAQWLERAAAGEISASRIRIIGDIVSERVDGFGEQVPQPPINDEASAPPSPYDAPGSFTDVVTGISRGSTGKPIPLVRADGSRIPLTTALAEAFTGSPDVAIYADPVTSVGRVELLPFLREQAISMTNHRFGIPVALSDEAI
ncbi:proline dehydrogenase family protein [Rathayibacter toxicus]|uniref:proline dehydrogenase family protein n=1 Tax=Rathayibacter toxicus TaxID=145458 RepID=UPI000A69531A|nr:bifunctional proline dehydrogenase/L-glutamate gamma-semialdehyde dehydrogenase [Rathayibacter toxicus]QOD08126.1 bifunctional proline dehydrogenase/L-glutamate gamma-semialdehyde dehydrogenase [Rathayibacter toxicus]QOD10223.1 bifunctional proline dehydrogenase/L-glutamate gamma-semialdehyde dehydrogenase [Rathayibacter toxicus]